MFLVEFAAGWLAESTGLIADSLDMLANVLRHYVLGSEPEGQPHPA